MFHKVGIAYDSRIFQNSDQNINILMRNQILKSTQIKEIPSEEGLGIAKSPEGPKLDPHF